MDDETWTRCLILVSTHITNKLCSSVHEIPIHMLPRNAIDEAGPDPRPKGLEGSSHWRTRSPLEHSIPIKLGQDWVIPRCI